jgi:hypothetical protein
MAIGTAVLLGVGLYLLAALPVAVVIGRLLGGPPAGPALAGHSGVAGVTRVAAMPRPLRAPLAAGLVAAQVAASRPVALVARDPHPGGELQLAGAEAHPAHA